MIGRELSCRIVATALLALLFTGCMTSDGESELLAALAALPLEFEERGIWFANPKQSMGVGCASRATTFEEFRALPEDQRKLFVRSYAGRISFLTSVMRQTLADWEDAYGFSFYGIDAVTVTDDSKPLEIHHFTGEFDEDAIVESLTDLGYRTEPAGDEVYYAIGDDFGQDLYLTNQAARSVLGSANRIYVGDNLLAVSPDTPPVLQSLRARKGESPSLADSPAFASIARGRPDPLNATPFTREATVNPDIGKPRELVPGSADRPEEWEVMHQWEAFGAGYNKTPDTTALRFALYYPHRDWADLDAETLVERVESYLPQLGPQEMIRQFCESWSSTARVHGNGSTLTVACEMPTGEDSAYLQHGVTDLVPFRLLGFLAP